MLWIQKGPQGSPAARIEHGKAACSPFPNQRSARQRPDDSHRPVRPATKHRGVGSSPAFRRSVPSCGLCGSLSSAALPSLRTSDFLLNSDTDVILSWMQRDVNGQKQRIGKRQDAARVLPDWQRPCRLTCAACPRSAARCRSGTSAPGCTPSSRAYLHLLHVLSNAQPALTSAAPAIAAQAQPGIHRSSSSSPAQMNAQPTNFQQQSSGGRLRPGGC